MSTSASEVSEFGKDIGVVHEAIITGRKVGAGKTFWSRLAHNESLFRRIMKEVMQMVVATRLFDPVKFIGEKWSLIAEEQDLRSTALAEVDFSQALFETCLKEDESFIKGEEKLARLKVSGNIRLGTAVFMGLWDDYQAHKEDSVLERLFREQNITHIDFFGDVLLDLDGVRCVLCLCRDGAGVWDWDAHWFDDVWTAVHRSASLASQSSGLEVQTS